MAQPCQICGQPVHETVVKCPHCGDDSGAPVDSIAVMLVSNRDHLMPAPQPPAARSETIAIDDSPLTLVDDIAGVVGAAIEAARGAAKADAPSLPVAIARKRRRE